MSLMQASKYFLSFIIMAALVPAQSQKKDSVSSGKNSLKINLPSLIIRNICVQYERKISPKSSVALAVRYMPDGKLPFASTVDKILNDPYTAYVDLNKLQIGN